MEAATQLVWLRRTPLGRPVVPEEKRRQIGVVERAEGERRGQGRRAEVGVGNGFAVVSAEWRVHCLGLLWSSTSTLEGGMSHCWAVAIVFEVYSGEQMSSFAWEVLVCRTSSLTVKEVLAPLKMPPAAKME